MAMFRARLREKAEQRNPCGGNLEAMGEARRRAGVAPRRQFLPQHFEYFLLLPRGHRSFRPLFIDRAADGLQLSREPPIIP
jgi:hypothetical protein